MTSPSFSEGQRDALRELANVGSGHAAAALSKLLGGRRVAIDPPHDAVRGSGEPLGGAAEVGWSGDVQVSGGLRARFLVEMPRRDANLLSG